MPRPAAATTIGAKSAAYAAGGKAAKGRKAKAVLERPSLPPGWLTSDENEIGLRRWRGRTEILSVAALEAAHPCYGTFRTESASGGSYEVEIRGLDAFANSCGCIDYRVNGLGTCKHIEGTLAALANTKDFRRAKAAGTPRDPGNARNPGSPRVEVFLDRRNGAVPAIMWPAEADRDLAPVRDWLSPYLARTGR